MTLVNTHVVIPTERYPMPDTKPAFIFVHGGWVDSSIWRYVIPLLEAHGHVARALDLPGSGRRAKTPLAFGKRPLDAAAFATEPSPNTVEQNERTQAVVALVEGTARETGGPVVLVGQSLGGLTLTAVAEAIPDRLRAIVYISAFLQSPGTPAIALLQHESNAGSLVPPLFLADPRVVGASRIDPRSDDAEYRARVRNALCADASEADFSSAFAGATCDEPVGIMLIPAQITAERFGRVPRHYVRCLADQALKIEAQDYMIAAVDSALKSQTHTHTLASSHFPFYSQPKALAEILRGITA
jgi:pimeloyl-ACP methyl ester carboxylesterase